MQRSAPLWRIIDATFVMHLMKMTVFFKVHIAQRRMREQGLCSIVQTKGAACRSLFLFQLSAHVVSFARRALFKKSRIASNRRRVVKRMTWPACETAAPAAHVKRLLLTRITRCLASATISWKKAIAIPIYIRPAPVFPTCTKFSQSQIVWEIVSLNAEKRF